MISIIIPAFNSSRTIENCINSIVASGTSGIEFEIIIINDGSTDNTEEICLSLTSKYSFIKYFKQNNQGVSAARNYGIEKSNGEYICFVDSDDMVMPEYLTTIQKYCNNSDITFFGFIKFETKSEKKEIKIPKEFRSSNKIEIEEGIAYLLKNNNANFFGFTWSKIFSANIIKKNNIKFNKDIQIKEDELFTLEYCTYISSLQILNIALYHYNIFPTSLSHHFPKINHNILSSEYFRYGNIFNLKSLRQILHQLGLSYKLGELKTLKHKGNSQQMVFRAIESDVLPLVKYRFNVSRWFPYIKYIPSTKIKIRLIYYLL